MKQIFYSRPKYIKRFFIITPFMCALSLNLGLDYAKQFVKQILFESPYQLKELSGLPVLHIDTHKRAVSSNKIWVKNANYFIFDPDGFLLIKGETSIKGRGNTTWEMAKKPYSLKLLEDTGLLGMHESKRWVLLANFSDKTLLRSETALYLGRIYNHLRWTPNSVEVDLFLNGKYMGVYQLTEQISIDEAKVNVGVPIDSNNPLGGYLLEIDIRRGEEFNFDTRRNVIFCCADPDENLDMNFANIDTSIFERIKEQIQILEDSIFSEDFSGLKIGGGGGYRNYIDIDSVIDWYLVNEIGKNNDAAFRSSVFFYFDPVLHKFRMGPIWDFDIAFGNIDYTESQYPQGLWVNKSLWFSRFFEDTLFKKQLKKRWNDKKTELETVFDFIDKRASYLDTPQKYNFKKWRIMNKKVWPNPQSAGNYRGEIDYLKTWLRERIDWLDAEFNSY